MVKHIKGKNTPVNDLEGDANVESDCEGYSSEVKKETQEAKEEEGEEPRVTFITGSFSAYELFYPDSFSKEMTGSLAGNHSSSTAALTRSCSLPSNRKVPTLARITFAKIPWRRHPLPARQRASMFWLAW